VLTGVTLIVAIVFGVNMYKFFNGSNEYNPTGSGGSVGDELDFESIVNKEGLLLELLDRYYYYDVDVDKLEESIFDSILLATGDKYAAYYTPEEYKEMLEAEKGEYCGIGVAVQQNMETMEIVAIQPYENAPGAKAGMKPGDIFIAVDGRDIRGMELDAAVALIKGEEGTEVKVTVLRDGEEIELTMVREIIEIETVDYEMIEDVLYVYIDSFEEKTPGQFKKAIEFGKENNMTGIIFDLRSNPGGLLPSVVSMLDMLIDDGLLVYVEDKNGNRADYRTEDEESVNLPMVCLVNQYSASGAELFSGTLQDYGLAKVVGVTTYGKGVVQTLRPLTDGSALKFTTYKYFTGGGSDIDGKGVVPDVEVPLNEDAVVDGYVVREKDDQYKAAWDTLKEMK